MLTMVLDSPPLRIVHQAGAGPDLCVSFSSIGHDPDQMPSPEFSGTLRYFGPSLFVMDASRSWGNAPGLPAALETAIAAVRATAPTGRLVMIGQSMGAYAAMVAASLIPADIVIAFGPQPRIDPAREPRWREWTARLDQPRFADCPMPDAPAIWMFHGLRDDRDNALAFPVRKSLTHVLFADQGHHDLCPHLKSRGVLRGLVGAILQGDRRRALRIASGAGGRARVESNGAVC